MYTHGILQRRRRQGSNGEWEYERIRKFPSEKDARMMCTARFGGIGKGSRMVLPDPETCILHETEWVLVELKQGKWPVRGMKIINK